MQIPLWTFSIPQPRHMGAVNWRGMWGLYLKEVRRFWKVFFQTVAAPVITSLMFLLVMVFAFGRGGSIVAGYPFEDFLVPGLVIMTMIQNAFANTSSSILVSKVQGNIVDVLMPPLSAFELTVAWTLGGVTRGIVVGIACAAVMALFADLHLHNAGLIVFHAVAGCMLMSTLGRAGGDLGGEVRPHGGGDEFHRYAADLPVGNVLHHRPPAALGPDPGPLQSVFLQYRRLPLRLPRRPGHRASPVTGVVVMSAFWTSSDLACHVYLVIRSGYKLKA